MSILDLWGLNKAGKKVFTKSSKYRGVYKDQFGSYHVKITIQGVKQEHGPYATAEEAAQAYDELAEYHHAKPVLNFKQAASKTYDRRSFTDKDKQYLLERQNCVCNMCAAPMTNNLGNQRGMDVDHLIPLAAGGADDETNLQCLCLDCHRLKTTQIDLAIKQLAMDRGSAMTTEQAYALQQYLYSLQVSEMHALAAQNNTTDTTDPVAMEC